MTPRHLAHRFNGTNITDKPRHNAMITLTNDFHGSSTRTHSGLVTASNVDRIRNTLCGIADCCCATSSLGTRGEQDATIEEMGNGSFHVASIASDTSTQIETPAEVLARLLGEDYNDVRGTLDTIDWVDIYPEVDRDGILTGNLIAIDQSGYDICDVTDGDGIRVHDCAIDAMVVSDGPDDR